MEQSIAFHQQAISWNNLNLPSARFKITFKSPKGLRIDIHIAMALHFGRYNCFQG